MSEWQPIETAPKGYKLIVGYRNRCHVWRSTMACYYPPNTLEMHEDSYSDDEFAPEGWYEETEEHDMTVALCEEPTHWMPLPEAPTHEAQSDLEAIATEALARVIYESWAAQDGYVPWVERGNSTKQEEARLLARRQRREGDIENEKATA